MRLLLILIFFITSPLISAPRHAQAPACSGGALAAFSENPEYDAACAAYAACNAIAASFSACSPHFLAERLAECETDDVVCLAQGRLQTALISLQFGNGYQSADLLPASYWTELAAKLLKADEVSQADEAEITSWFAPLAEAYGSHPALEYVSGVVAELNGNSEAALAAYNRALSSDVNAPVVYLTRGDLLAAQGEPELAALDYFMLAALTGAVGLHENLETLITTRTAAYPFDLSAATEFARYRVLQRYGGPGGGAILDESLVAPDTVKLLPYAGKLLLIPADAEPEKSPYVIHLPFYTLERSADRDTFTWAGDDYVSGYFKRFSLTEADSIYTVEQTDIVFEGVSVAEFILAPPDSDDPRPEGFRCEGAPLTRLQGADSAIPLSYFEPVRLYDAPGSETFTEFPQTGEVFVITLEDAEPVCADGFTWYQAAVSDDQAGWIRENTDATSYFFTATGGE